MSPGNRRVSITIEARNQASRVFRQLQADINATNTASSNLSRTTAAGNRSLEGWTGSLLKGRETVKTYASAVGNLHGEMIGLGVAQRGLNNALDATAISQGRAAVNLERLQVALQTISGSTAAATAQYERLVDVARLPGINLENSLRASTQLQAIGKSGEEATDIIRQFGNALALSSQSPRELRQTIRGLSQLSTVGSVLQEDLEIVTSRISVLNRGLKELGGPRAEGIRKFYDALGVPPDQQGPRLVEDMLNILRELPRAGNTAANAIENLFDTTERAQATIGRNFLPIIRESTSALEGLAARIEKTPELARTIALFETFAGTLGTVAVGIAGVGVAVRFLGPALIATFTNPIGLAALAVGGLAAAVLTWRVATQTAQQPLRDLNPLIERNTELIERNRRAKEENNREELQSTGQSLQDATGQIQRRIEVIRESGSEALGVLSRLDERLQNLRGSRGRQTSQLAISVEEQFDDAFIAVRGYAEELTKAEAELQRLTETAEATDAITDGFEASRQAAESLRDTIRKLGVEISEGASTDNLQASLAGRNVNPQTLLRDLVDVQGTLNQLSEAHDDIASNAANSTEAQAHLTEIQGVLTDATERYLDALSASLALTLADTDAKESEFEEIQRLAQGYVDYYQGRGDAFQAYVNRADGLAERATDAIAQLDLAEQAEDAQAEAEKALEVFTRNRERAAQRAVRADESAAREREQSQRANLRLGEQLDEAATKIFKDQLKERTEADQDAIDAQLDARVAAAKERAAAADRVADRVAQRRADELRETEKAEKEKTRIAERESRQRTRQAEREAERIRRRNKQLALDLVGVFETEFDLDFLSEGLQAAFGDPTAFAISWAEGFLAGVKDILDGAQLSPFQEEIQGLRLSEFDTSQLEQALTNNLAQQARLLDAYSETTLQGTAVWESLIASEMDLRDQLKAAATSLVDSVAEFLPGFGDQRTPLYREITQGLVDLGLSFEEQQAIVGQFADSSLSELRNLNSTIQASVEAPVDATFAPLRRIAENTQATASNTRDSNVNLRSVFSLLSSDAESVERLIRAQEDTPLQDYLDNRQAIVRLFSAEKIDAFIVAGTDLAEAQKRQIDEQALARSAPDELTFLDNLELLLREAGPIDPSQLPPGIEGLFDEQGLFQGLDSFIDRIRDALVADVQGNPLSEDARADLISDLEVVFQSLDILPETANAFSTQLAAALDGSLADLQVEATLDPDATVGVDTTDETVSIEDLPEGTTRSDRSIARGDNHPH